MLSMRPQKHPKPPPKKNTKLSQNTLASAQTPAHRQWNALHSGGRKGLRDMRERERAVSGAKVLTRAGGASHATGTQKKERVRVGGTTGERKKKRQREGSESFTFAHHTHTHTHPPNSDDEDEEEDEESGG